ncbi:hypothetical protein DNTS_032215 [Danionella cerebrum]|uniref:Uncharacterized protein n=1 Tax=Danionella cerebrum TaxID=2873325 RepID=A0A553N5Q8_9TELE|nr:hypothetical protein DNTS_032215 [Danionella translucida]
MRDARGGKGEEARHNGDVRGRDIGKVVGRLKEVETGTDKMLELQVKRLVVIDEMWEEVKKEELWID